jgi:ABC-2 type transport system ATP-binding protein
LLDEPLTGLDPEALGGLRELLQRLGKERTLIMVTHQREDVVGLCDNLVFMDRGRVTLTGARADLAVELERFFAGQVPTSATPAASSPSPPSPPQEAR